MPEKRQCDPVTSYISRSSFSLSYRAAFVPHLLSLSLSLSVSFWPMTTRTGSVCANPVGVQPPALQRQQILLIFWGGPALPSTLEHVRASLEIFEPPWAAPVLSPFRSQSIVPLTEWAQSRFCPARVFFKAPYVCFFFFCLIIFFVRPKTRFFFRRAPSASAL